MEQDAAPFGSVLIVDDHPLYAEALRRTVIAACAGCATRLAQSLGAALAELAREPVPDLVLLDLTLPDAQGTQGVQRLRAAAPEIPVLVVSAAPAPEVVADLIAAGAAGFMPKEEDGATLAAALREVAAGRLFAAETPRENKPDGRAAARAHLARLTPQQGRVLAMICDGKSNRQIAEEMGLVEASVKSHVTALLRRLEVQNRTQAALLARQADLPCDAAPGEGG